jgi:hypothetical protein
VAGHRVSRRDRKFKKPEIRSPVLKSVSLFTTPPGRVVCKMERQLWEFALEVFELFVEPDSFFFLILGNKVASGERKQGN